MTVINGFLFVTKKEMSHKDFNDNLPKRKYLDIKVMEDCIVEKRIKVQSPNGNRTLTHRYETHGPNRAEKRLKEKYANRLKNYKLDYLHKKKKKNRAKRKRRTN